MSVVSAILNFDPHLEFFKCQLVLFFYRGSNVTTCQISCFYHQLKEYYVKVNLTSTLNLQNVTVARCYKPSNFGKVKSYEFHHFSDSSYSGYGQCSYIRMINKRNEIHCALVMANR